MEQFYVFKQKKYFTRYRISWTAFPSNFSHFSSPTLQAFAHLTTRGYPIVENCMGVKQTGPGCWRVGSLLVSCLPTMTKSICYYTIRVYIILTLTCHVLLLTIFLLRRPYFRPTSLRFQRHHRQQQRNKQGFHVKLYSTDDNPRTFLENLGRSLNYSKDSDWYNINAAVIKQHGGKYANSLMINNISLKLELTK